MANQLECQTDTPEVEGRVLEAFKAMEGTYHQNPETVFEHDQWYVNCKTCGAQWSVNDAEGPGSIDGFCFEQISEGDEYCERNSP
jgi:ribosomal protein S27E